MRYPVGDLAVEAHRLLAALKSPQLEAFMAGWPDPRVSRRRAPNPGPAPPALRWLDRLPDAAPPFSATLVTAIVGAAQRLTWRRSYSTAEASAEFLDNYAWTEFVGLQGPIPSDHLACGVLLLGPEVTYPPHRHEAEEIYVPLAGTAAWMQGRDPWVARAPGTVIHHARHVSHAMRTSAHPLLALYLWRSDNLAQHSVLDPPDQPPRA